MTNEQIERLSEETLRKHNLIDEKDFITEDPPIRLSEMIAVMKEFYTAAKEDKGVGMKWRQYSKSKPEKGERVLCDSIYGIQIGWLTKSEIWEFTNGGSQLSLQHWMPLPNRPGDESQSPSDQGEGVMKLPTVENFAEAIQKEQIGDINPFKAAQACYELMAKSFTSQPSPDATKDEYNANFLWGFEDESIEAIGYEFANAKTEEYQKECWESLKQALRSRPEFQLRQSDGIAVGFVEWIVKNEYVPNTYPPHTWYNQGNQILGGTYELFNLYKLTPEYKAIAELSGQRGFTEQDMVRLINDYWRFDNNQQHLSTWHDKQDLIEKILKLK